MRVFRILGRNIRDSFKSVFRNFSLSIASISCITITLIVVSISIILTYNVNNFATLVERDVTIVAFLNSNITNEQKIEVEDAISKLDYVETYSYKSKIDIAKEMIDSSDKLKNIISSYTEETSPIQPTFLVKVTDINKVSMVAENIKNIKNVGIVKYGEGMVEQLISVFNIVREISIGIVIALVIVTAFLISNTIKLTIFSRKREIEIMRLVGASNINIKIPFILEGLFLGIIGALIPVIITIYGYISLFNNFKGQVFSPFIKLIVPEPFIYNVSLTLILIGMLVGMFGSYRAVKKHLKI
ncbi:MAG: permease-like cell division protein FtsX [Bacilli bacterium]